MIHLKSAQEIEKMAIAGRAVSRILDVLEKEAQPGISTGDLDEIASKLCKDHGVVPAFKGYKGFSGNLCVSINHEVVHGIPTKKRKLHAGDIVGLDFGVIADGWYGDSARTVAVGKIAPDARKLMDATREGLRLAIEQCFPGKRLFDIGAAIQNYVEGLGFSVVREFVGHGIGRALHEDPQVPNFGSWGKGLPLKAGMVLAIEPMINAGGPGVEVLDDGWTAVTEDGALSAHFEHTVAITEQGPRILTVSD